MLSVLTLIVTWCHIAGFRPNYQGSLLSLGESLQGGTFNTTLSASPWNPQSNGKVESAVNICENITRKTVCGKFDYYLALVDYRNTPTEIGSSPVQRPFSRRKRNLLSLSSKQLDPKTLP